MAQNPNQRLYGSERWRRMAKRQLQAHPLCAMCLQTGLVTPAQECDHVVRHKGDPKAFWTGARQSLCKACHQAKSAAEEGFRQRGYSLDVDGDGFPMIENHPANLDHRRMARR